MRNSLAAGTLLGWTVDPPRRIITFYRSGEQPVVLRGSDTLTAGDLMSDFPVPVADVFILCGFFLE